MREIFEQFITGIVITFALFGALIFWIAITGGSVCIHC